MIVFVNWRMLWGDDLGCAHCVSCVEMSFGINMLVGLSAGLWKVPFTLSPSLHKTSNNHRSKYALCLHLTLCKVTTKTHFTVSSTRFPNLYKDFPLSFSSSLCSSSSSPHATSAVAAIKCTRVKQFTCRFAIGIICMYLCNCRLLGLDIWRGRLRITTPDAGLLRSKEGINGRTF